MDTNTDAPHSWLCNGRLLRLHDPRSPGNMKAFEQRWTKGEVTMFTFKVCLAFQVSKGNLTGGQNLV